ncbi:MAG: aminotransferase class I/II-fold pyridoxal phosphate-dependent enzyme, partial [Mariniphaga sp.]
MWKIQLFKLNFDQREAQAAKEVIESGWLTMGERIAEFESNFSKFLGSGAQCTAVANGTAALHMALLALDIKPEDEVIIPALTFVADANVVRMVGAKPVLADCTSLENWNMSADTIAAKITPKTKVVIIVHYAGFPCDMVSISELCRTQGIKLIEDVAHAPGATWNG